VSGTLRVLWEGLRAEWWDFFGGRGREIIREEVARKKGSLSEDGDEVGKVAAVRNGDGAVGFGTLFLASAARIGGVVRSADGAGRGGGVL